jgi:hypothetical protein
MNQTSTGATSNNENPCTGGRPWPPHPLHSKKLFLNRPATDAPGNSGWSAPGIFKRTSPCYSRRELIKAYCQFTWISPC